jgi:3-oxoacyl-(acyl-carrier-protein) synthase
MTTRRVVVTGLGAVTPLGHDLAQTGAAIRAGRSAGSAPEIRDFNPRAHFRIPKALKVSSPVTRYAVAAASMALADARWPEAEGGSDDLGVMVGSCGSDLQTTDLARAIGPDPDHRAVHDIPHFAERILGGLHPLWLLVNLPNMISAHVAIQLSARGQNNTIMTDWVAGSQSIGEAYEAIRRGDADAMLAGGSDSGRYPFAIGSHEQAGLFEPGDGEDVFLPGEGAAILLLEDRDSAIRRGAPMRAEVRGYATGSAWIDPSRAAEGAVATTMRAALDSAEWAADDVQQVVCTTIFSRGFLPNERASVAHVFGGSRRAVSYTAQLGHALGAAGPIDVALSVALANGPSRTICSTVGCSGQAATLAIETLATHSEGFS